MLTYINFDLFGVSEMLEIILMCVSKGEISWSSLLIKGTCLVNTVHEHTPKSDANITKGILIHVS